MADDQKQTLQFVPFSSYMDMAFLHTMSKNKLEVYGLDESAVPLIGFYTNGDAPDLPSRVSLDYSAFNRDSQIPARYFKIGGELHLKNTIESFKNCDKKEIIAEAGLKIWKDIESGLVENEPERLLKFILLMFADMKNYRFYYWFAFPALCYPNDAVLLENPIQFKDSFLQTKELELIAALDSYAGEKSFFIIHLHEEKISLHVLNEFSKLWTGQGKVILAFSDPSTLQTNPGWPLRNLLAFVAYKWSKLTDKVEVLCLRDHVRSGVRTLNNSLILKVQLIIDSSEVTQVPNCVGWEKNERQKLGPRMMNLSSSMDPIKLAESSVDLNLKLMKWRLVPTLDIDKIMQTKCLLLGAGTLGCNVARSLLGWGVRNITLVDNGKVSYSNPVRQTLFKFNDCLDGGKYKAEAAAAALHEIFPGVNATGKVMSIPMPGHPIEHSCIKQVRQDVLQLEELISNHDVVFLLMDTRESRWLPTLIAASKRKLVINAALGYDTYLVMRHGLKCETDEPDSHGDSAIPNCIPGSKLGCYFCGDVVAPGNSTRDRTLDQQCTVTRPGVSMMAAALAVELMVSVVHHPQGGHLPALVGGLREENFFPEQATTLGIVPHQIRGFLSQFSHILPATTAFNKCAACSTAVISKYNSDQFEFLLEIFNNPSVLEDLSGLTELHDETQSAEVWELSD